MLERREHPVGHRHGHFFEDGNGVRRLPVAGLRQLEREDARGAIGQEFDIAVAGAEHVAAVHGADPAARGASGEVQRVLHRAVGEGFKIPRAGDQVHHLRLRRVGRVVAVVAPDGAELRTGANDLADVALEAVRADLTTIFSARGRRAAAGEDVERFAEVAVAALRLQPRLAFRRHVVEPADERCGQRR